MKDVLKACVPSYTLTSLTEEVFKHEICSVGALTGACTAHGCKFNHYNTVSKVTAAKVVKLLESAISPKVEGAKGAKKEKP